jgi:hypothetical protein
VERNDVLKGSNQVAEQVDRQSRHGLILTNLPPRRGG